LTGSAGSLKRVIIIGGAGFIGSHFADRSLADAATQRVTLYDNFSSGQEWHFAHHQGDARLNVVRADVGDLAALTAAVDGNDTLIHLAANPDIARAATEPAIDFVEGTVLSHHVVEAMRQTDCKRILYASGSGVYGDLGAVEVIEDHGPMRPISTYGASKLAGEAMISSYCHMFGLSARVFRFGNVVGARQTHGVGLDFIAKLRRDPARLDILGDGNQSKPYIHVDDVLAAVLHANEHCTDAFAVLNAASVDAITVTEIADLAAETLGMDPNSVQYVYAGGARGWSGDVPVVRLNCDRLRALGWTCQHNSAEAIKRSLGALASQTEKGQSETGKAPAQ